MGAVGLGLSTPGGELGFNASGVMDTEASHAGGSPVVSGSVGSTPKGPSSSRMSKLGSGGNAAGSAGGTPKLPMPIPPHERERQLKQQQMQQQQHSFSPSPQLTMDTEAALSEDDDLVDFLEDQMKVIRKLAFQQRMQC